MAAADNTDSAMIALVPRDEDAARLAVDGYEPPEVLHVTLTFLGDAAAMNGSAPALEAGLRRLAAVTAPVEAKTWAVSHFNPKDNPCAVYLVGAQEQEHNDLDDICELVNRLAVAEYPGTPEQHSPWVPHLTIGYELDPALLTEAGNPIVFDRFRLAVGPEDIDIPLTGGPVTATGHLMLDVERRLERLEAIVAARGAGLLRKAAQEFNELLHPRGKDGRFIEKNGFVKGNVTVDGPGGRSETVKVNRAKVAKFIPNPSNSDDPFVEVTTEDGRTGRALASTISTTAGPKARLDGGEVDVPETPDVLPLEDDPADAPITAEQIAEILGKPGDAIEVDTPDEAVQLLAQGKKVHLRSREEVAILLDKMREIVAEAKEHKRNPWTKSDDVVDGQTVSYKGKGAWSVTQRPPGSDSVFIRNDDSGETLEASVADLGPVFNLCNVTVEGSSLFCVESKGINRIKMPQLKGIPLPGTRAADMEADSRGEVDLSGEFRKMLEDRGVPIEDKRVPAVHLKASQNELDGIKTAGIAHAIETGSYDEAALFISSDNYIVDGHHRWSAMVGADSRGTDAAPLEMPVSQVDMDILELLAEANRFALDWGIPQASVTDTADSMKERMAEPSVDDVASQTELLDRMGQPVDAG